MLKKLVPTFSKFFGFACLVGLSFQASANVSLRNGNFFIGYTDVVYSGGFEPKIDRVYNSKTPYKGIFGWGWGNEYEVYMSVSADGSVVVHEYGGGAENRFTPVGSKGEKIDEAVVQLATAAQKSNTFGSGTLESYKKRLKEDATFRNDEWNRLRSLNLVAEKKLPVNTQLVSNRFSYQYITKVQDGYVRSLDNGKMERFNEAGKLTRVQDKNSNFLDFSYDKNGRLVQVSDNFNRKIKISYGSNNLVENLINDAGKKSSYKYNANDELVASEDVDGNKYTFKYSNDQRHNLVEIGYEDKTDLKIAYYPRDQFENVKSVKDRDGTLTEYKYDFDKKNRLHLNVAVQVKSSDGSVISSSSYEYTNQIRPDGEEWNQKLVTVLDGEKTETAYNEFGLPILIKRGGEESKFEYDLKGRVTRKETPTEVAKLAYDQKAGKVSRVERKSKVGKAQSLWSEFQYDAKGNLTAAKNSDKKAVNLFYDNFGRISSMVDQSKRRINFKYNEMSKPVQISDPSLGTITVTYSNSGEIKKVDSSAGRKVALQVTSSFQNLLDIIRPAGVSLAF